MRIDRKLLILLAVVFTGVIFLAVGVPTATDVPDTIKMESKVYPKHTKPLVTLSHKKHNVDYKIACTECHHVYKDGKNIWKEGDQVQKCEACHSEPKKPKGDKTKMEKAEKIKKYHYDAIHANCRDCHKELQKEKKPAGPVTCVKCHVTEK
jgi:hypothetical protein